MFLRAAREEAVLRLTLLGDWTARDVPQIEAALDALSLAGANVVEVDARSLARLDLSGAWLLFDFERRLSAGGTALQFVDARPAMLQLVAETLGSETGPAFVRLERPIRPFTAIGVSVVDRLQDLREGLAFIGETSLRFARGFSNPRVWRPTSIARHVYDTGITAIPIVALIAFLISVIIAYMGAQQLQQFGADIFVVDLVTVGVLRELGVLLTAIIVAGRSGSAFAAEIGSMRLNQEVDALRATGVEPIEVLILPRWIGLVIALPLLTVIADAVGVLGGALLCNMLLDMPLVQYFQRVDESIGRWTFWVGLIKAPVFALLIAGAGTYRGLQVRGSSRELGRLTTVAVVQAIFLVILADALFAVMFMEMGI
jgi:phospholipid/cholesterol/gamma-HCH transport system permease protein